ncbi:uncharacterized protein RAG0_09404 [Rhynchosporium agropyri]|uniref:Uncharacterized protein n=1 Tax=Rhynchosporium agropyri TaxID=914238 RepID=A0A1E1KVC4_9HELO|nr:uncharacterized protein RAG0_09404 [Rhynchosporium agropyri]
MRSTLRYRNPEGYSREPSNAKRDVSAEIEDYHVEYS